MTVAVVGAGLAGLVAAHALLDAGVDDVVLLEAGAEPGGTTVLSSGWIWRYRDLKTFAWGAPQGDRKLQAAIWNELPDALIWLDRRGVRVIDGSTDNELTDGIRIDPAQAIDCLARKLPDGVLRCDRRALGARSDDAGAGVFLQLERDELHADRVIFAGGGYAADLERVAGEARVDGRVQRDWAARNAELSDGSSMNAALALGAMRVPVNGEVYSRAMPVGVRLWPDDYVRFSQVYGEHACLVDGGGNLLQRERHDWSDTQLMWRLARSSGRGWYVLTNAALTMRTPYGQVAKAVREARAAGAEVLECQPGGMHELLQQQGVQPGAAARTAIAESVCAVAIRPGITHTLCGLRVDTSGRVMTGRRQHSDRLWAAGVEVGGVGNGGYASGLAQALALGRIAGASAAAAG